MKFKKPLFIALVSLDVAITVFYLVVSIIMLSATATTKLEDVDPNTFIGYLQLHTTFYLWVFVVPLFVLLAANIVGLVIYVRKTTKQEPVKVDDLTDEQKAELRKQLLEELGGASEDKKDNE